MIQVLGFKFVLKEGNFEEDFIVDKVNVQVVVLYKVFDVIGQMNLIKVVDFSFFCF